MSKSPDNGHAVFKKQRLEASRNAMRKLARKPEDQRAGTKADLRKKAWRLANPEKDKAQRAAALAKVATARLVLKKEVYEHKAMKGCADCPERDPVVLDFDHRDREKKLFSIPFAVNKPLSRDIVFAEIAKCDVRCANCHRRKTAREMGYYSFIERS